LLPAFDSGENLVGIGSPAEGFWIDVGLGDEAVDGGLQVSDGSEHPSLEATSGELGDLEVAGGGPVTARTNT
jgi:hypothetical protein